MSERQLELFDKFRPHIDGLSDIELRAALWLWQRERQINRGEVSRHTVTVTLIARYVGEPNRLAVRRAVRLPHFVHGGGGWRISDGLRAELKFWERHLERVA